MFSLPYPDYTRRATWIRAACAATQPAFVIHNERPGILDRAGFVPRTNTLPGDVDVSRFRFDAMGRAVPNGSRRIRSTEKRILTFYSVAFQPTARNPQ